MDAHNVLICFWDLNDVAIAVFPIVIYLRWCEHLFSMTIWKMAYKLISICFISFFAATQVDLVPVDAFCKSDCQCRNRCATGWVWLPLLSHVIHNAQSCNTNLNVGGDVEDLENTEMCLDGWNFLSQMALWGSLS